MEPGPAGSAGLSRPEALPSGAEGRSCGAPGDEARGRSWGGTGVCLHGSGAERPDPGWPKDDGAWPGRGGAGRAPAWERGTGSRLEGALQGRLAELLGECRLLTVTPRRRDGTAPSGRERRWRHGGGCRATRKLVSKKEGPTPGKLGGGKSGRSRGLGCSACPFPELVLKGGGEKRVARVNRWGGSRLGPAGGCPVLGPWGEGGSVWSFSAENGGTER